MRYYIAIGLILLAFLASWAGVIIPPIRDCAWEAMLWTTGLFLALVARGIVSHRRHYKNKAP